ncbi:MAG: nuclear transport factor 2 family protein [Geminicoccaceae bacterium]
MAEAATIAERYIALWNEADPVRRHDLLAAEWSEDATYADPLARASGHAEIDTLIGAVQQRFPGFRFTLVGTADGVGDRVRSSWALGPEAQPDMIMGTDFVLVENGRLKSVTGFLDKVPAHG